jgi:hypothetical protein
MQRAAGNYSVGGLLERSQEPSLGPPIRIGSPEAPEEREADRIADILTAPEEPALPVCAACAAGGAPCPDCGGGGGGVLRRQVLGNNRSGPLIQAKLTVGEPNDPYEQEADRVAEQVMSMAAPATPTIQRQVEEEEPEGIQPKLMAENITPIAQPQEVILPPVQHDLERRLSQSQGGGSPLPDQVRTFMEPRFGADFSQVRVHTGRDAVQMNQDLNAHAFTHRQDVYFGAAKTPANDALTAHELTHVVQQGDERMKPPESTIQPNKPIITRSPLIVARAVDPTKAKPIKEELNSIFYVSNSKLEELWASLGVDLPEAINTPTYRDLWFQSVNKEGISISAASKPVRDAFARDTIAVAKSHLSAQYTRLQNLQDELKRAKEQNKSQSPSQVCSSIGKVDVSQGMCISTELKPLLDARNLVDNATILNFLQSWEDIFKTVPVGMRRVDTSNPLPSPSPPTSGAGFNPLDVPGGRANSPAGGAADQPMQQGLQPILFNPQLTIDKIMQSPNVAFVDREELDALEKAYRDCDSKRSLFKELAETMLQGDANLAVLAEQGELKNVSALSGSSDKEAESSIARVAKENAEKCKTFLDMLNASGTVDWHALRPVHSHLLAGGAGGGRDWSNITARGFVEAYFKEKAEAERTTAELQLAANVGIGLVTFIAMLSPAAPLAASVLAASSIYGAATVAVGIKDAMKADKTAGVMAAGADAGLVTRNDAQSAKEDAESKKMSMVFDVLLTVLPYLPSVAKGGAKALSGVGSALGREATWATLAKYDSLGAFGGAGGELVVDLAKAGVSAMARNAVGGKLSLNFVIGRNPAKSMTLGFVKVGPGLVRGGDETLLHAASKYGLSDYIRYHIHAPGLGLEGYPIVLAPTRANQFANNHIETFMRNLRDKGAHVDFGATFATFGGEELRPFITRMLQSGDPKILGRLALDQGRIENFLKSITYDIRVTQAGKTSLYRANITVGPPGSGMLTTLPPTLVP